MLQFVHVCSQDDNTNFPPFTIETLFYDILSDIHTEMHEARSDSRETDVCSTALQLCVRDISEHED